MKQTPGSQIKILRDKRSMTLDDLAKKTGINRDHIGRIERGETRNPRIDTLQKIAKALDVNTAALLFGEAA